MISLNQKCYHNPLEMNDQFKPKYKTKSLAIRQSKTDSTSENCISRLSGYVLYFSEIVYFELMGLMGFCVVKTREYHLIISTFSIAKRSMEIRTVNVMCAYAFDA